MFSFAWVCRGPFSVGMLLRSAFLGGAEPGIPSLDRAEPHVPLVSVGLNPCVQPPGAARGTGSFPGASVRGMPRCLYRLHHSQEAFAAPRRYANVVAYPARIAAEQSGLLAPHGRLDTGVQPYRTRGLDTVVRAQG